ncbi:MAG: glycosyltransferase family 4 protein [Rubritalea sp.]|uniref:glycosyltransferase family 4 protein n=1 Tax=Rubritalea sp. TaxID=2109375 RepID=UPI003241BBAC
MYPPHEIGGYELRCADVCNRLLERGHHVRVLTSDHEVEGRPLPIDSHVARKLEVHGMYGNPWLSMPKLYQLEKKNHRALIDEIEAFQPEVVHVWNMGGISKSLLIRLESMNIPLVYDISDHWIARSMRADVWLRWWNESKGRSNAVMRTVLKALGVRAKISREVPTISWDTLQYPRIYFCSGFLKQLTLDKGWAVNHGDVIHCGIETQEFTVKTDYSSFSKLLWVGRLAEDKDPITAVRALAECHDESLSLDLFGNGDTAYVELLRSEIERLQLTERVKIGSVSQSEMKSLYAQYDCLLFTSNWGEPFALTPLEAMSSGLPVISSLDGGQRELAQDGVNSLVAEAAQPKTYASKILEYRDNQELRERVARNGLDQARNEFDIEVITNQIESYLTSSLKRS